MMKVKDCIQCKDFPCTDVRHDCYMVPDIDVKTADFSLMMISEATPQDPVDYYYSQGEPLFQRTTVQAFKDAGINVSSIQELLDLGIYFTTAVKCGKTGYGVSTNTIRECSLLLEKEIALFPNIRVLMLMGDVAIKAVNYIAKRMGEKRVIPAGSTYKIRNEEYYFKGKRAFPSYLQAGPSFFIEKSKRKMIAEDIERAMHILK